MHGEDDEAELAHGGQHRPRLETCFESKYFKDMKRGASQSQNLALTVLCVPSSLDSEPQSGCDCLMCSKFDREGYLGVHGEDDEAEFAHGGQHRAHPLAPLHVN